MYVRLPRIEIWVYFLMWTGGIAYSVYHVYLTSIRFERQLGADYLTSGWSWVARKKDIADYEWHIWLPFLSHLSSWFILHFFTSELLRWFSYKEVLRLWYVLVTALFVVDYGGTIALIVLTMQPCLLFLVSQSGWQLTVWGTSLPIIIGLNFYQNDRFTEEQQVILSVCIAWLHLRSLSFCIDLLNKKPWTQTDDDDSPQILRLLSYTFYLPFMFLGPFITYKDFEESLNVTPSLTNLKHRLWKCSVNLVRFIGWLTFTEWALHFIYCNALQVHPEVLPYLNAWALNGLAYCIGQFFLNKYVVVYGLMGTLANLDGIHSPPAPRCIAHVSLYSDMWRHFDRGFYNFLVSYVYIPLLQFNKNRVNKRSSFTRQLWCSLLSFTFVYVWHGLSLNILVWSVCNFIGLSIETLGRNIAKSDKYQNWENRASPQNIRRWHALATSPLFVMSALTMFYFFGGMDVGNVFVMQVLDGSLLRNSLLLFFSYCMCQVSIETKIMFFEKKNQIKEDVSRKLNKK